MNSSEEVNIRQTQNISLILSLKLQSIVKASKFSYFRPVLNSMKHIV